MGDESQEFLSSNNDTITMEKRLVVKRAKMKKFIALIMMLATSAFASCATTEYKAFEGNANVIDGKGGTKVVVDGMEIWDNGEPPRKFKIVGIIDDERPGGLIPMSQLHSDIVKKARAAGGDAIIQLNSQSQISGYYSHGHVYSSSVSAHTSPVRRNISKFAVIKYIE